MSTEAKFQDLDEFKKILGEVRSDKFETNWVLVKHVDENPHEVTLAGYGNGGTEEMKGALEDNGVMYGLVRFTEKVDESETIKFVYIHWIGKDCPFSIKGKSGVVHGDLKRQLGSSHVSVEADNVDDLEHDVLMKTINENSGTINMVLDTDVAAERKADRGFTDAGKGRKEGGKGDVRGFGGMKGTSNKARVLKIDDAVFEAADDVRNDITDTNWFVAGYEKSDPKCPVICLGSGNDGITGVQSKMTEDMAGYALLRVTDVVDDISTVKFAYIQWVGERVKPMAKAKISTHKSDLEEIFRGAHATIFATSADEIYEEAIMDKIQSSSGSKSHVRNTED